MRLQCQHAAFIARNQHIGLATLGHRQQKIVKRINRPIYLWQVVYPLRHAAQLIDQLARQRGPDE